jgi:hypothetical protein
MKTHRTIIIIILVIIVNTAMYLHCDNQREPLGARLSILIIVLNNSLLIINLIIRKN